MTVRNGYMYGGDERACNGQDGRPSKAKQASKHEVRQGEAGQAENGGNANSRDPWL